MNNIVKRCMSIAVAAVLAVAGLIAYLINAGTA